MASDPFSADIERLIQQSESKIATFESQISALESQATALLEQRDRESACVAALRYIVSPIHALAAELLAEIFEHAIHDDTHVEDVFRVSQVCSDWRQVAHSTPRLWTGPIRLEWFQESQMGDHVAVEGLKAWLARSASLPVSIEYMQPGIGNHIDPHIQEEVLRISPRWCSLKLRSSDNIPLSLLGKLAGCTLDGVVELDLGGFYLPLQPIFVPFFCAVPQLQKLSLRIPSDWTTAPLSIQTIGMHWAGLTDLTLSCPSPDLILDILSQCPHLVRAALATTGWLPQADRDILTLGHLRTLAFPMFPPTKGRHIPWWDRLSAPALEELCIAQEVYFEHIPSLEDHHVTAFQKRAPNITRLEVDGADLTSKELRAVVRRAPSLTHLKLVNCPQCFGDALFSALHYTEGMQPLAPRLHDLVLEDMEGTFQSFRDAGETFTEELLASMIASRWWTDAELAASRSDPPAVARWTHVKLGSLLRSCSQQCIDILKDLPSHVLVQ